MVWDDSYAIGVNLIDKQHRGLFTAVNRLASVLAGEDDERNRRVCVEAVKYLKHYALQHFADEEAYQLSIGYAGYAQHKKQHEAFVETALYLEQELEATNYAPASVKRLEGVLTGWLLYHVMHSDQAIVGRVSGAAGMPNPGGSIAKAMESVLVESSRQLFHNSLELADPNYAGGFSGGELFSILDYKAPGRGSGYRFLLAMEEVFALRMISGIAGHPVRDADEMATATILQLAGDMTGQVMRMLEKPGSLERKRILHHAEAKSYILPEAPACSLLFSSERGALVARVWEL